MTTSRAKNVEN